jgi:hypothetical protein
MQITLAAVILKRSGESRLLISTSAAIFTFSSGLN